MATRTATKKTTMPPAPLPAGLNALLDREAVCRALQCRPRQLATWIATGKFPRGRVLEGSRRPRWTVQQVNAWVAEHFEGGQPAGEGER